MSSWSLECFDGMPFSSVSLSFRFFTASLVFVELAAAVAAGLVAVVAALNDVEEEDDEAIESLRDRFV